MHRINYMILRIANPLHSVPSELVPAGATLPLQRKLHWCSIKSWQNRKRNIINTSSPVQSPHWEGVCRRVVPKSLCDGNICSKSLLPLPAFLGQLLLATAPLPLRGPRYCCFPQVPQAQAVQSALLGAPALALQHTSPWQRLCQHLSSLTVLSVSVLHGG